MTKIMYKGKEFAGGGLIDTNDIKDGAVTSPKIDYETEDAVIKSSGVIQNNIVKFGNGLMIASGRIESSGTGSALGSMYRMSIYPNITFVEPFISSPNVTVTTASSNTQADFAAVYTAIRDNTGISRIDLLRPTAFSSSAKVAVQWMAIGFWK